MCFDYVDAAGCVWPEGVAMLGAGCGAWLLCALVCAAVACQKGRGWLGLAIGCLLGPVGLLVMICWRPKCVQCPCCLEWVYPYDRLCRHCHYDLDEPRSASRQGLRLQHGSS